MLNHIIRYLFILIPAIFISTLSFSQTKVDSLLQIVEKTKIDSTKANALTDLCWELKSSDPELALIYGEKALAISKKTNNNKLEARAMKNVGVIHLFLGNYDKSEEFFNKSLEKFIKLENKAGMSGCYNNLGMVLELKGNFNLANEFYHKSLKIDEETKNENGVANSLNNLGNIYQKQGNYKIAIEYYIKVLAIREKLDDKIGVADSYNNIGSLYETQNELEQAILNYQKALILYIENQNKRKTAIVLNNLGHILSCKKQYSEALDYFLQALEIRKEYGQKEGIASTYQNIGELYQELNRYKEAYEYFSNSLAIFKELKNEFGISKLYVSMGTYYLKIKKYEIAIEYLEKAVDLSLKLNFLDNLKEAYHELSVCYSKTNNYTNAYKNRLLYEEIRDSLENSENSKKILQIQLKYEFEKNQKELEFKREKQKLETIKEINKQKLINYFWIVGFLFLLLILVIIYFSYKNKISANQILQLQKDEIQDKNDQLELYHEELLSQNENIEIQKNIVTKHRDELEIQTQKITDSIQYAKRIQNALLPSENQINNTFKNSFIIYKPKDIVSGDFYWFRSDDDNIYLAVADCTGHGVPGAFMSLLSISYLNEIVVKNSKIDAAEILNKLRDKVINTLNHNSEDIETRDGLDISLCIINKNSKTIQYAGAYNSIFIKEKNNPALIEIKGDKMPIGMHFKENEPFTNKIIQYTSDSQLYLFTDGYIDQFGGAFGRKLLISNFKEILKKYSNLDLKSQKKKIEEEFENWKDTRPQIDDILIMSFKI
ncbi:MAG: tetratricopeptide repeat protein [Bacteroidales bacterium]|nr:tetratricopeptide repeat protein [Bacteroidales bacterium]